MKNSGSAVKSLGSLNSFNSSKNEGGTGVFLPRAVGIPQEKDSGSKKVPKPTTVLLPARLVQALGLNVDQENNVVLKRNPSSLDRNGGKSGGSLAVMKLVPDDSSVIGNGNGNGNKRNGGNGGNGGNGCKKQGVQKGKGKGQKV